MPLSVSPHAATSAVTTRWTSVTRIRSTGAKRDLLLSDGQRLGVHRFACAGVGDSVRTDGPNQLLVQTVDGSVPVLPAFEQRGRLRVARRFELAYAVSEITTPEQLAAYESLSSFHYRSERGFGRRSVLVLSTTDSRFPLVLGFVEVATPFLHLRNRSAVFDAAFSDPERSTGWERWDMASRNRLTNVVARISRIVVHPEARGLGLTKPLVEGAAIFARQRWQVKGLRPLFLEITADMLRFMPFVERLGMRYIGESGGNLERLGKDMAYLLRAREVRVSKPAPHSVLSGTGHGILSRQRRDLELVASLLATTQSVDVDTLVSRAVDGDEMAEDFVRLLRHPKPTYLLGLTPNATAFLARRCNELRLPAKAPNHLPEPVPTPRRIRFDGVTVSYTVDTGALSVADSSLVRRAFGLSRSFIFVSGVHELSALIEPSAVCYITGASGSGKSTLIDLLANRGTVDANVAGHIERPRADEFAEPRALDSTSPLISAIGASSLETAIRALNAAGLAEPRLYLSSYRQLSAGQRYRAQLAQLICSGKAVWLVDEFASGLDDGTALAVARNFSKIARQLGATLVVAGVREFPILDCLDPDIVIRLSTVARPRIEAHSPSKAADG